MNFNAQNVKVWLADTKFTHVSLTVSATGTRFL